jgi:hypothetical protein
VIVNAANGEGIGMACGEITYFDKKAKSWYCFHILFGFVIAFTFLR